VDPEDGFILVEILLYPLGFIDNSAEAIGLVVRALVELMFKKS